MVIPAILLIIKYNNQLKFSKCELYRPLKFDKLLIIVVAISLGYVVIGMLINHKGFWFNSQNILGLVIVKYIVVGGKAGSERCGQRLHSMVSANVSGKRYRYYNRAVIVPYEWYSDMDDCQFAGGDRK